MKSIHSILGSGLLAIPLAISLALPLTLSTAAAQSADDHTTTVFDGSYDLDPLTQEEVAWMEDKIPDLRERLDALRGQDVITGEEIDAMLEALDVLDARDLPSPITYEQLYWMDALVSSAENGDLDAEERDRLAALNQIVRDGAGAVSDAFAELSNLPDRLRDLAKWLTAGDGCAAGRTVILEPQRGPEPGTFTASARFSGRLIAPGYRKQRYEVTCIVVPGYLIGAGGQAYGETLAEPGSGKLTLSIKVGGGASNASFDVFPAGVAIPTDVPRGSIAGRYDIRKGRSTSMRLSVGPKAHVFNFGATGNWFSDEGTTNSYSVEVTLTGKPARWNRPPSDRPSSYGTPSAGMGIRG